jgi:hypothetical protein
MEEKIFTSTIENYNHNTIYFLLYFATKDIDIFLYLFGCSQFLWCAPLENN